MDSSLTALTDKIALELVFAAPGKDSGLLPINSLLTEMETRSGADAPSPAVGKGLGIARQWIDAALEAGEFSAGDLERLGAWTSWLRDALAAEAEQQPAPPMPGLLRCDALPELAPTPRSADSAAAESEATLLDIAGSVDLLREFVQEAQEHLSRIELDALALEESPENSDTLNSLFRSFHTLKGGSGFLNIVGMNRLAHELEALLDLTRQGKLSARRGVIDLILAGQDTLRQFVVEIERRLAGEAVGEPFQISTAVLLERVRAQISNPAPAAQPRAEETQEPEAAPPVSPASITSQSPPEDSRAAGGEPRRAGAGFVKVDTAKLDSLIDLVGELVIAQSLVVQNSEVRSTHDQQLVRNMGHLGRITKDLQHIATSLRMVPIRATFQKMTRLVRDVAAKSGRIVELRLSGEDTELDRNLIEQINDPLIHMLRNSVDHGIENPQEREARGKPAKGTIHLRAFHQGGSVMIQVEDDGAGLNKERILAKARKVGLVSKEAQLTEQEIFGLIFEPGFSTAEKVTDISGRGVGMDVVRRNIAKLRGKVEVRSTEGKGSVFSIYLPLTLAIIDGLIFSVGHERFIVPTLSVRESFRPEPGMISNVLGRGEMVSVRGQFSPLVRLYERFSIKPETTDPTKAIVIVVDTSHQRCAILVDRLLGKQEVVIKGLGEALKRSAALAGAAILGDGRVGLILDVNGLAGASSHCAAHN